MTATQRLGRLLALVPWVAARPEGVPIDEVCARFEVSRDDLLKDLDTVMMVGVHPFTPDTLIDAWIADGRVMIRYADTFARPLRLTADEAVALISAARGLSGVPGVPDRGPLERATAKLTDLLGPEAASRVDVDLGAAESDVFSVLTAARADEHQVSIDYPESDGSGTRTRRIEPARLFSSGGRWYVSGWCHDAGGMRIFRVDRIGAARATGAPFENADEPAPDAVVFGADLPRVELEVDVGSAWLFEGVPVLERTPGDGVVRFTLAIASTTWLARLLVQLGDAARVVAGDRSLEIASAMRGEVRAILAGYR